GHAPRPESARAGRRRTAGTGRARRRPELPSVRGPRQVTRPERVDSPARHRPVCALRRDAEARRQDRSIPRFLPGLRVGQGGDGPDVGQDLHAGRITALGNVDATGRVAPRRGLIALGTRAEYDGLLTLPPRFSQRRPAVDAPQSPSTDGAEFEWSQLAPGL